MKTKGVIISKSGWPPLLAKSHRYDVQIQGSNAKISMEISDKLAEFDTGNVVEIEVKKIGGEVKE